MSHLSEKIEAQPPTQRSLLFASLYSRDIDRRLTVLDVGPATPETVKYFSGSNCRLVFADLFDDVLGNNGQAPSPEQWQQRFECGLNIPSGVRFDVCLFWDLLNYLDDRSLRAFCHALQPFVHEGSVGHGLGLQSGARTLPRRLYGIRSDDSFVLKAAQQTTDWPCHTRPPTLLPESLPMFPLARAVLLSNGRMEYTLRAAPGGQ